MNCIILKPGQASIVAAADAIRRGELVIFPTETVYGLATDALNESAVRRVFEVKGRMENHPLPVQVAGVEHLGQAASDVPENARLLAQRFWPGPLTLVMKKNESIPGIVSGGLDTIGIRVPDHPVALALLREVGSPIVATSANLSGRPSPKSAQEAIAQLGDKVSVTLDAGACEIGVASTVVDVSSDTVRILRLGAITPEQIHEVIRHNG
ncbi:MAG: L-threonylcarbamoyladenylate synthase [Armatimonadota bacterium]|nr:threonylcarbamoyl-AMP synthase [bacterium]